MVEPSSSPQDAFQAETPAQKRALSYSNTIHQLFVSVMNEKLPADRIVGEYFRTHKKHGSKDRRVIRESLFALFRWWGWLKKVHTSEQQDASWFASLSLVAELEGHQWSQFSDAWREFANLSPEFSLAPAKHALASISDKCEYLNQQLANISFNDAELLPEWFWQLANVENSDKQAIIEAMCSRPPIWGRAQTITQQQLIESLANDEITAVASEFFDDAVSLGHKSVNLNAITAYQRGKLEIQDLGSQVIGQICAPKADEQWWDTCSGAGGKTLQLRSLMLKQNASAQGSIVSSDIRRKPLEELAKRAKRAGFNGITTAPWKSDDLPVKANAFDGVLVDAPCSCTGTWRRNPDMRWLDDASVVTDKHALQLDILSRSANAVKSQGQLVYATCSLSPIENEQVVNAFLAANPEFELQTVTHPFTGQQAQMLTIWPHEADTDGMFVVKMKKH
ncbi:RsmB/NOP family class I SAM-dependent RNA methyltransferase [Shewanella schlegeliana]|uniref:RsmB/NOP family class I SAM-dependent RNA methyltransferase n=1 Tax=Shewanella schlegeliana TaxID=190308 RepID=A0ABS1T1V0_9GAMM|nr:RsmB/NOP family class I SAM-dependent RNA methyltransferase [Shewanella schlegeliana]MBL4913506.1 RsmB/NOP family class I SAM-dependent RNA methyltransferase [Shewanella schlegeliana]MCL1108396.1 RsmB/NOP family class I SAM-dependent RNA methyltransferase [Shewanella schlegeliana]GIU28863.1 tRNA/rRNA cytosine-C5-methylase RsmB [Shewanella schlegeliana]